jgi:hypothetical protein
VTRSAPASDGAARAGGGLWPRTRVPHTAGNTTNRSARPRHHGSASCANALATGVELLVRNGVRSRCWSNATQIGEGSTQLMRKEQVRPASFSRSDPHAGKRPMQRGDIDCERRSDCGCRAGGASDRGGAPAIWAPGRPLGETERSNRARFDGGAAGTGGGGELGGAADRAFAPSDGQLHRGRRRPRALCRRRRGGAGGAAARQRQHAARYVPRPRRPARRQASGDRL